MPSPFSPNLNLLAFSILTTVLKEQAQARPYVNIWTNSNLNLSFKVIICHTFSKERSIKIYILDFFICENFAEVLIFLEQRSKCSPLQQILRVADKSRRQKIFLKSVRRLFCLFLLVLSAYHDSNKGCKGNMKGNPRPGGKEQAPTYEVEIGWNMQFCIMCIILYSARFRLCYDTYNSIYNLRIIQSTPAIFSFKHRASAGVQKRQTCIGLTCI
jgi:hypothetical protein